MSQQNPKEELSPLQQQELKQDGIQPRPTVLPPDKTLVHPHQAEAMALVEKFTRSRRMAMGMEITKISGTLVQQTEVATFPEVLFVEHFVPLFAGVKGETEAVNYQTWIAKVSGGEMNSVDIINEEGKVVWRVPPMLERSIMEQRIRPNESMTYVERQYSRLKEIDAAGSQLYLEKKLSSAHVKDKPTKEVFDNIRTWNAILTHYGFGEHLNHLTEFLKRDPNNEEAAVAVAAGQPAGSQGTPDADVKDYGMEYD